MTDMARIVPNQPRARGAVRLDVVQRHGRSDLAGLRQSGSLRLLFPRTRHRGLQAVLINTAGGITGGDVFGLKAGIGEGATLTLTTQAAERAYRALPGQSGRLRSSVTVGARGHLNWLPQETLLFDGSALRRHLVVDLDEGATALVCEALVFGRAAMGERLRSASFVDHFELRRERAPLFLDRTSLHGDIDAHMVQPYVANGAGAMALVAFVHPGAAAHLQAVRDIISGAGGATLLRDGVLVARILAEDSHALRQALIPILTRLSADDLPRPWMI